MRYGSSRMVCLAQPSFAAVIEELHSFHQRALKTTYEDEMTKGPDGSGCCSVM